jgi:hypothetical protein
MPFPQVGDVWRRSSPPGADDLEHSLQDPRFLKFCQPGAILSVTGVWKSSPSDRAVWVDALCGGDTVVFQREAFVRAYGMAVPSKAPSSSVVHDVRNWSPGEMLDDIPLLKCPSCGKTAFDIGPPLDYLGRAGTGRTYVHVVSGLTDRSGTPIVSCEGMTAVKP